VTTNASLLTSGTGTDQLSVASGVAKSNMTQVNAHSVTDTASGVLDVNAKNLGGTAQTGRDIGASVLISPASPDEWDAVALTFAEPVSSTPSNFNRTIEYPKSSVA
jgi:hypothetical protein